MPFTHADLKRGDILVQTDKTIWTWIAKVATGHPYPHVMMVESVEGDGFWIWEDAFSVRHRKLQAAELANYEVWRPKTSEEVIDAATAWMASREGEVYGFASLARLAVMNFLHVTKTPWEENDSLHRGMVCSEALSEAFEQGQVGLGIIPCLRWDPAPDLEDQDTKPWDWRNPSKLDWMNPPAA